MKPLTETYRKT